jgi:tRNA(Ile2) C34 agmatinyltransferase TiaS
MSHHRHLRLEAALTMTTTRRARVKQGRCSVRGVVSRKARRDQPICPYCGTAVSSETQCPNCARLLPEKLPLRYEVEPEPSRSATRATEILAIAVFLAILIVAIVALLHFYSD